MNTEAVALMLVVVVVVAAWKLRRGAATLLKRKLCSKQSPLVF